MPRFRPRLAGILFVVLLAGCGGPLGSTPPPRAPAAPPVPSSQASPAPQLGPPRAPQQLTFSGDLSGTMTQLAVDDPASQSECTGTRSRAGGVWASTLYGYIGGRVYGFVVLIKPYRGPGVYGPPGASVEVHSRDDQQVWQAGNDLAVSVSGDELTGQVRATLVSAASNQPSLQLQGRWSCQS
jgi:hypothetical protein